MGKTIHRKALGKFLRCVAYIWLSGKPACGHVVVCCWGNCEYISSFPKTLLHHMFCDNQVFASSACFWQLGSQKQQIWQQACLPCCKLGACLQVVMLGRVTYAIQKLHHDDSTTGKYTTYAYKHTMFNGADIVQTIFDVSDVRLLCNST